MEETREKAQTLSISIPFSQYVFLREHKSLSPSAILQRAIHELEQRYSDFSSELVELKEKNKILAARLQEEIDKNEKFESK